MKVRGSVKITKNLILSNPNGSTPKLGRIGISDGAGNFSWGDLVVIEVEPTVYNKGSLVVSAGILYYSTQNGASGALPLNPLFWAKVIGDEQGTVLTQDQIDAINNANLPTSSNPFATVVDIKNITIKGTDTLANILLKSPSTINNIWLASTAGVDSYGAAVAVGFGLISDRTGWVQIGMMTGVQGIDGEVGAGTRIMGSAAVGVIRAKNTMDFENQLFIATNTGVDDDGIAVAIGDGLVSDGIKWFNVGPIKGGKGDPGDPGIQGVPGPAAAASTYIHTQSSPSATWTVIHNLGRYPSVTVVDTTKSTMDAVVTYLDGNSLVVTLSPAASGYAYLN